MPKQKYLITTEQGEEVGFLVIEEAATFTHIVQPSQLEGPIADLILLLGSLAGFSGATWFISGPGWIAPTVGISITAVLAGIKAWRSGHRLDLIEPQKSEITIKVESWSDEGQVLLDEIQDKSITLNDWRKVAKAIISDNRNFSRTALAAYITQGNYHKIKNELCRLNMAHRNGNSYLLSPRGLAFLRKVNSLPY